jgi:elongation factor Ts
MAEFTAKDVQALRQLTGAGMMDAKKALVENGGDAELGAQWLREKVSPNPLLDLTEIIAKALLGLESKAESPQLLN